MVIAAVLGGSLAEVPDELEVMLVEPLDLSRYWEPIIPYLQRGEQYWNTYFDLKDLYVEIFAGRMQLWLVGDKSGHFGCFLTEIRQYPKANVFRFVYTGGAEDGLDKLSGGEAFHDHMILWAQQRGATHSEIVGRPAWRSIGKKLGYTQEAVFMRRSLEKIWRH